ncbi:ABC transporter permease [Halorhodospira abdelmalekii]|uniref:ABC transporter permease n=1 Tax=Halorhodospira abdelmalekii TaxID=421629 RepID=UPI001F5B2172|nr:proline/glycine betaine ABC transporter permease [Halorhodospira abdelmalekii]MBK1733813.1 ABC transporter permease [Halorhodospira abdelmalekii]
MQAGDAPDVEEYETIGPIETVADWVNEHILEPITIGDWIEDGVDWVSDNLEPMLDGIEAVIRMLVDSTEFLLLYPLWLTAFFIAAGVWLKFGRRAGAITALGLAALFALGLFIPVIEALLWYPPPWMLAVLIIAVGTWRVGWRFGLFALIALALIFSMDLWPETIRTLSLVVAASIAALIIGLPIGIAMSRSDKVQMVARPVLDLMQTMPPFVYLIPAAIFFGLGTVPGAIATLIFAMPPAVRLTNLGIRQVSQEHVEAGQAFGCTKRQLLFKIQLPLAMPSIMAGINQTIMLALSMVVIASMIGAGGLGGTVLTGIQRLQVGLGFEGGLAVVFLAILLDRISQSFGESRRGRQSRDYGALLRWFFGARKEQSQAAGAAANG